MADAGALRGPAVAGHARAIVEHVGDVQLHIAVHPRESASEQRPELPERTVVLELASACSQGPVDLAACCTSETIRKIATLRNVIVVWHIFLELRLARRRDVRLLSDSHLTNPRDAATRRCSVLRIAVGVVGTPAVGWFFGKRSGALVTMQCQLGLVEFGGRREINTGRLSTWRGVGWCVHHEERGPGLTAATGTTLIVTLTLITPLSEIQKPVVVVSATIRYGWEFPHRKIRRHI
ncbi:hypothetical protein ALC53_04707 [Atta colombica]|uniref:Uncharacterized protein n=1 Tax=Atta colombica TaxID=520822 RepID=A0A195BL17_9HYME|nr:hypothetical protein ALC53_04707 [Atta colombica]